MEEKGSGSDIHVEDDRPDKRESAPSHETGDEASAGQARGEIGIACATLGLVISSLSGGPVRALPYHPPLSGAKGYPTTGCWRHLRREDGSIRTSGNLRGALRVHARFAPLQRWP